MTRKLVNKQTNYRNVYTAVLVNKYYCNLCIEQIRLLLQNLQNLHTQTSWRCIQIVVRGVPSAPFLNKTQIHGSFNINGKYTY